jgi:hypothetical protein
MKGRLMHHRNPHAAVLACLLATSKPHDAVLCRSPV